ncbi:hypothetical protein [Haloferula sargassicola]|uniref:Uncharacterized protein n=1 Tax=Haloferula sargassicola TaxID=490096 RepID=A0ABP9UPB5_9BACT
MIPVAHPIPEPPDFDKECRERGTVWWATRRLRGEHLNASDFPNYWTQYEAHLSNAFHQRCGWWAMWIAEGQVEHYLSIKNHPGLAYEWSNYRFVVGSVNGSKRNHDDKVLDPFDVEDGWFEVLLPSMQLILTDHIPPEKVPQAEFTLKQLRLRNGTKVVRSRKHWYDQFKCGNLDLEGLKLHAPLVAEAVGKLQSTGQSLP